MFMRPSHPRVRVAWFKAVSAQRKACAFSPDKAVCFAVPATLTSNQTPFINRKSWCRKSFVKFNSATISKRYVFTTGNQQYWRSFTLKGVATPLPESVEY
jgi:hypothetical protein